MPFMKDSQRGIRSSSNSSLMKTRFTYSRMLRLFFSQSCAQAGEPFCRSPQACHAMQEWAYIEHAHRRWAKLPLTGSGGYNGKVCGATSGKTQWVMAC